MLQHIRPILRKTIIDKGKSVKLKFKSIMIELIQTREENTHPTTVSPKKNGVFDNKILTPILVPVERLERYLEMNAAKMEIELLKNIY